MTVLDDVDQLIKRLSPHAICDDCYNCGKIKKVIKAI